MISLLKTSMISLWHAFLASIILFAPLAKLFEPLRAIINDESVYFALLTLAILIDLVVGVMKHVKLHAFSFRELVIGLIIKVVVAYGGLILFLSFAMLEDGWASDWFTLVAKFTVLLYPAGSAISSMYCLTDGSFPPISFMRRLKAFDEVLAPTIDGRDEEKIEQ